MKKIILISILTITSFTAQAAILTDSYISGHKRICVYSDGTTIHISSGNVCRPTKQ